MQPASPDRPSALNASAAWGIPLFYAVAVLARTVVIVIIPTLAFRHFDNASLVSALYFIASLAGLLASLLLPAILKTIGPWRLTLAASATGVLSAMLFLRSDSLSILLGLSAYLLMVQLFETVCNVYALHMIPRRDLVRFEPRRMLMAGIAYGSGPIIGMTLLRHGFPWSPFFISAACAVLAPVVLVGLVDNVRETLPAGPPAQRPARAIRLFLRQPRLRLAWMLAIGRAAWWQVFFVYTPILFIAAGYDTSFSGAITGIASGLLLLSPIWGMWMRRIGLRRHLTIAYATCGLATVATGLIAEWSFPWAMTALMAAALTASGIDSAGNAPFLRSVRQSDRLQMVPIYNSYREMSQILPTAVFTFVLMVQDVSHVFQWLGASLIVLSLSCRNLPRRA
ncbi:MFS transporter [Brucella pseudogrignonensis]|uniref:MFS transporter n=1 Tax=Brucella pseudogrignonensis TaxID=419475 RepID=UPI003ED10FB2